MPIIARAQETLVDLTDGYSVILTSEAYTFLGTTEHAIAGTCSTEVIAMRGGDQIPCSVDISKATMPTGITLSKGNTSLLAPKIIITASTNFETPGDVILPVSISGTDIVINKQFSVSIAFTGATGAQGPKGADGVSPTVSVTKSGTKTTISITDKTGTHTQVVNDGTNGTPGAKGADGRTPYFHVKYSNDGGSTFTSNSGETVGTYIGTCTDYNLSDPTSVSSYKWARIKGDAGATGAQGPKGADGPQGVSVSKIVTYYKLQASSASAPASPASSTSGWSTTEPAFSAGSTNTLYTCEQSTYSNGSVVWGSVQKSSSYEAAKEAYNKSVTAQNTANSANNNANAIKNNIYVPNTTTINGGKIATGSIKAAQIASGTITAAQIASGTITAAQIASGTITAAQIASGTITADKIDAQGIKVNAANVYGRLTANQIDVDNIFAQNINATGTIKGITLDGTKLMGAYGSFKGSVYAADGFALVGDAGIYRADSINSTNIRVLLNYQNVLPDSPDVYIATNNNGTVHTYEIDSEIIYCTSELHSPNIYHDSSRIVKTNIVPETEESARRILDLDVVKFDYKPGVCPDSSRFDRRGLIAEDTLNVMPEIVYVPDEYKKNGYTGDNTKVPSIDYIKIIPDLVKMVQIQQKQLDRVPKNTAGTTTLYFADSDHVIIFSRSQADATAVIRVCNAEFRESNPIFIKDVVFSIESDSWLVYIDKKTTGYLKVNYTITVQEES